MHEVEIYLTDNQKRRYMTAQKKGRSCTVQISRDNVLEHGTLVTVPDKDFKLLTFCRTKAAAGKPRGCNLELLPHLPGKEEMEGGFLLNPYTVALGTAYVVDPKFRGSVNRSAAKAVDSARKVPGLKETIGFSESGARAVGKAAKKTGKAIKKFFGGSMDPGVACLAKQKRGMKIHCPMEGLGLPEEGIDDDMLDEFVMKQLGSGPFLSHQRSGSGAYLSHQRSGSGRGKKKLRI